MVAVAALGKEKEVVRVVKVVAKRANALETPPLVDLQSVGLPPVVIKIGQLATITSKASALKAKNATSGVHQSASTGAREHLAKAKTVPFSIMRNQKRSAPAVLLPLLQCTLSLI